MLSTRNFLLLLLGTFLVCILNLRLDVMEIDAAQYAQMSFEMMVKKNFLQPTNLGADYLDKPPLIFWLSSVSMMIFGTGNFAYKFPSLLFGLLAIYATYRLAKIFYSENIARVSALMLSTSQALFVMTNDVRTDTTLMGAVIFSIWQWVQFFETGKVKNLLTGGFAAGLALLAKGPIGLIAVAAAIVPHVMLKKKWWQLFDLRILISVFVIALMLLPMSIGLYQQHGLNGLKFYFWTQSFGRITGESEWNNHPDTFFLVHSTAWQILPWTLFFFAGWITSLVSLVKMRFVSWSRSEFITVSGFTFVLLALSLSKYQLPHYIFVVFPLASIMAAKYFDEAMNNAAHRKFLVPVQAIILSGLFIAAALLQYSFAGEKVLPVISIALLFAVSLFILFKTKDWLITSAVVAVAFNILLSVFYFPEILKYQPQCDIGRYVKVNRQNTHFICYRIGGDFALAFYSQQLSIPTVWDREQLLNLLNEKKELLVYTSQDGFEELKTDTIPFTTIEARNKFSVTKMNLEFLNPATRNEVCDKVFLLRVQPNYFSPKYSLR